MMPTRWGQAGSRRETCARRVARIVLDVCSLFAQVFWPPPRAS